MKPFEGYLGNPNLKPANVTIQFTREQLIEIARCADDPIYFIRNYVKIVNVDAGLVPFKMYGFQEEIVQTLHTNRFVICMIPRQSGKSVTTLSFLLHYILFNRMVSVVVLANKADTAQELLSRLQLAYEHLPFWLQQGIVTWNKRNIELENGSKIKAAATSSASVRGGSYNIIFLDEFAHIDNRLAEQFFTSVYPTISSGNTTKVIIVSTPLGMNHFHKMWTDAQRAKQLRVKGKLSEANKISRFEPIEVHYTQVPGRDDEWKEQEIANLGSMEKFEQEYLCDFLGSSNTLIRQKALKDLAARYQKPISFYEGLSVYEDPKIDIEKDEDGDLIKKPHKYVMCVDSAYGKDLDYSAFTVFDITSIPYKAVACYRNNKIQPLAYPDLIHQIATKYHKAFVLMEVNDVGQTVANALHYDLEYDNILTCVTKGRQGQQLSTGFTKTPQLGVKMTKIVKRIGCTHLKTILESAKLKIVDFDTIAELSTFIQVAQTYQADEGSHDDLVMTLVMFAWLVSQKYFKELTNLDIRLSLQETIQDIEEHSILPPPIFDNGLSWPELPWEFDGGYTKDSHGDVWKPVNQFGETWWNSF